ncbi:MAG TPA: hypothetical protein VF622_00840 [Segetibacter sp.]|jgi:endonuclease YncB( thermonuclease family)
MTTFQVNKIIDGDTIEISPQWIWNPKNGKPLKGNTIRIFGYALPQEGTYGFNFAREKLKKLLLGKLITIKNPVVLPKGENSNAQIAARVFLNDVDIANYFPEYRTH